MDAGEVLRQASTVIGRPVTLWEVTGAHEAVARASSHSPQPFDLESTLRRWNVPIAVGSRWISAPGPSADEWVIAPVRTRPPAPPPGGRERRSKERLALELAGLALGLIDAPSPPGMVAHQANNPLTAARAGLQLSMESIGRWVDLAADRRLALLDDLGQVLEDIDRTTEMLRTVRESARSGALTARGERGGRFDAVRVIRSCLTLERRLLRDRGMELEFTTSLEVRHLKGDPNALFDLLVTLVRNAAEGGPGPVVVRLEQKSNNLELAIRGPGKSVNLDKTRGVAEQMFSGTVHVEPRDRQTVVTISLPLPPQRDEDSRRAT